VQGFGEYDVSPETMDNAADNAPHPTSHSRDTESIRSEADFVFY
jgi:hypothetical protein